MAMNHPKCPNVRKIMHYPRILWGEGSAGKVLCTDIYKNNRLSLPGAYHPTHMDNRLSEHIRREAMAEGYKTNAR